MQFTLYKKREWVYQGFVSCLLLHSNIHGKIEIHRHSSLKFLLTPPWFYCLGIIERCMKGPCTSIWERMERNDNEKGIGRALLNVAAFSALGTIQWEGLSRSYQGKWDPCGYANMDNIYPAHWKICSYTSTSSCWAVFHLLFKSPFPKLPPLLHGNPYPLANPVLQPSKEEYYFCKCATVSKIMSKVQKKQNKNEREKKRRNERTLENLETGTKYWGQTKKQKDFTLVEFSKKQCFFLISPKIAGP